MSFAKQVNELDKNVGDEYGIEDPYSPFPKTIPRPRPNLSRPEGRLEKMYCWRYYINLILDPSHTRNVLDDLERIPAFTAPWGDNYNKKGNHLHRKKVRSAKKRAILNSKPNAL